MSWGGGGRLQIWNGDGIQLGCAGGASLRRPQRATGTAVVLFGRIDNRDEVLRALGRSDTALRDVDVFAQAYSRWGEDFLDRIIGDYACAVWDGTARRLIIGRDPIGVEPLHYCMTHGLLLFASDPRALFTDQRVPKGLDEQYMAAWLSLLPQAATATPYLGIERVPPGEILVAEGGTARRYRFWRPERIPTLRLSHDGDYADALRATLDEAVRCRLPASGPVGSMLSGGLDSTSVSALAARHLNGQGRRLTAFTAVPSNDLDETLYPDRICNEAPLAATVARAYPNIDHVFVRNDACHFLEATDRRNLAMGRPTINPSNIAWIDAIGREAKRRGIRVHLTGDSGNFTISYDGFLTPASLLRQGRLITLAREVSALRGRGQSWLSILHQAWGPFLPANFRRRLLQTFGRSDTEFYELSAINPSFARSMGIEEQLRVRGASYAFAHGADGRALRQSVLQRLDRGMMTFAARRLYGLDMLDPTADRRVVELCLSIPEEQFLRQGQPRSVIRRAMAGILPSEILAERRRGLQSADWYVSFTAARAEMLAEIERLEASPVAQRCLDLPRLRQMLDNWPNGGWHRREILYQYCAALSRALSAGNFIRRFEGGNF